jgi:EAL domain-containing protein (putative c-di-GMP-specific phosphodiesterase class I)
VDRLRPLNALTDLPLTGFKLDRSLTWAIGRERSSTTTARALHALAIAMGIGITAKGIDSSDHLDRVLEIGITRGQGRFYARPVAGAALEAALFGALPVAAGLLAAS